MPSTERSERGRGLAAAREGRREGAVPPLRGRFQEGDECIVPDALSGATGVGVVAAAVLEVDRAADLIGVVAAEDDPGAQEAGGGLAMRAVPFLELAQDGVALAGQGTCGAGRLRGRALAGQGAGAEEADVFGRAGSCSVDYQADQPASTRRVTPWTMAASSEAR